MPIGNYNSEAAARHDSEARKRLIGAGLLVGGFALRKPLAAAADALLRDMAHSPTIQRGAQMLAVKAFDAADKATTALSKLPALAPHFRAGHIDRRDVSEAVQWLDKPLTNKLAYAKAQSVVPEALRQVAGWDEGRIGALLQDRGFFQSLLYSGNQLDPVAHVRSLITGQQGAFWRHLGGANLTAAQVDAAARDINGALNQIDLGKVLRDANKHNQAARIQLARKWAGGLTDEITAGPSGLESLLGVRWNEMGEKARVGVERQLHQRPGALTGLADDKANLRFAVGEKQYDFSGIGSLLRWAGRTVNERLAIPFSPLQASISPGQLLPFVKRSGDVRTIGLLSEDGPVLRFHARGEVMRVDTGLSPRKKGYSAWEEGKWEFRKANKRHLKDLLKARTGADAQGGEGGGGTGPGDRIRRFLGMRTTPGSVPYWDAPLAFIRKFKSRDYVPNLLRHAADGGLKTHQEVLEVVSATQHGARFVSDDALLRAHAALQSLGLGQDFEEVAQALRGEGSSQSKWRSAQGGLERYLSQHPSRRPRIRRLMDELTPYRNDPRALEDYLDRTASFRAGREPDSFLGLQLNTGTRRLTHVDVLRHDLFLDMIAEARAVGASPEQVAHFFHGAGEPDAHSLIYAGHLEAVAYQGGTDGIRHLNDYIKSSPGAQKALRDLAKQRQRFLDLQPREAAEWEDFTERSKLIGVRKGVDFAESYRTAYSNGHGILGSALESTQWKRWYNAQRAGGRGVLPSMLEATSNAVKGVKDGAFGREDSDASLFAYWAIDRLHEAFENLGWGLPDEWKDSPGRLAAGMIGGRLLPLAMLPEANKFINRVTRDIPVLRWANPDSHRSKLLRAYSRASHRLVNHKHLTGVLPGLDFYTDSRDRKEEQHHERYADYSAVRKGRWWLFGSREAIFGSKVSYYLPSASRLAASDWQNSNNVNRNTARYWSHWGGFLNPTNWPVIGNPYWREDDMRRAGIGVLESGKAFDPDLVTSGPLNMLFGWLKPRRVYHPELLPRHLGGTLGPGDRRLPFLSTGGGGGAGTGVDPLTLGTSHGMPHGLHLAEPSRLGNAARARSGAELHGESVGRDGVTADQLEYLRQIRRDSSVERGFYHGQEIGGLYGWGMGGLVPELAQPRGRIEVEDASRGYGMERRFWDQEMGGLGGTPADILRRFLPHRRRSIHPYNPVANNMAMWLPEEYHTGNPYTKVQMGELRLPGEAYRKTHPGTEEGMWRVRASSLGKSQEEIEQYLVNKEGDGRTSDAAEMGTKMHRVLQDRWRKLGILEADEVSVYDKKLGVSGHIDGILRMRAANGDLERVIVDIKTKTPERFAAVQKSGKPEEENLEQIMFYMHTTGIHKALLTYVNRDDPSQVYEVPVDYSPEKMAAITRKLKAARAHVKKSLDRGEISEGTLYDPLSKLEILTDVAGSSPEARKLLQWASKNYDSMTDDEKYRVDSAKERLKRKREGFELHAYRFKGREALRSRTVKVDSILSADSIRGDDGRTYHLAGVKTEGVKTPYASVQEQWKEQFGVEEGSKVKVLVGAQDANSESAKAVILKGRTNVAKRLLRTGLANEDTEDYSAAAVRNRFSVLDTTVGSVWETIAHLDTPINTKLLPTRSGLEEYERTDVYGKGHGGWTNPIGDYVVPTVNSLLNKNPLAAAGFGAYFAQLFAQHSKDKLTFALAGAAVGVAASVIGKVGSSRREPPIPRSVRKRRELEEYYDNLAYLKYMSLSAMESNLAYKTEGINTRDLDKRSGGMTMKARDEVRKLTRERDALRAEAEGLRAAKDKGGMPGSRDRLRTIQELLADNQADMATARQHMMPVGQHALRAVLYHERAMETVRGNTEGGTMESAIAALPRESRSAIRDVLEHGSKKEKERLFSLLPSNQKAMLGAYLGVNPAHIPRLESVSDYFSRHRLPDKDWGGWRPDMSLELIAAADVDSRGDMDPMDFGIYPSEIEQATIMSPEASIPTPRRAARVHPGQVAMQIEALMAGHGLKGRVRVESLPPDPNQNGHQAQVSLNIRHRREHALFAR